MLRSAARAASRLPQPGAARGLATVKLPDLPYDFGALQPVISGEIMQARPPARVTPVTPAADAPAASQLHHSKHHAAYVANFNIALAQYAEADAKGDIARMIALQPALKFNGGGACLSGGGSGGCAAWP
jgi:Fe-Mn family superoxide dismutase